MRTLSIRGILMYKRFNFFDIGIVLLMIIIDIFIPHRFNIVNEFLMLFLP